MMSKKPFSLHVNLDAFMPATDEEKAYMVQMRPSTTFFRDGMKRLLKNPVATISIIIILIIALSSIFIPMIWPYSYDSMLGVTPGKPVDASYNNLAPFAGIGVADYAAAEVVGRNHIAQRAVVGSILDTHLLDVEAIVDAE